jgi:hypothetical protein
MPESKMCPHVLCGFYGVPGALFMDAAEQYYYERATQ